MTFISLGSGSCGNCYYLANETDAIIIDCGIGIRRLKKSMEDYGVNLAKVRAILVTHDHGDHIKSLHPICTQAAMSVYATETVHEGIDRNPQSRHRLPKDRRVYFTLGKTFSVASFNVTPFEIPHDASQNVGYTIESEGKVFSVMTDVGAVTENVASCIRRSQYLVIEANYDIDMLRVGRYPEQLKERITSGTGHLSNNETADALIHNYHEGLKHIWLCHLSEENNHPDLAFRTVDGALNGIGKHNGKDYMLDVLQRRKPTGPFTI